jgi:hypothetical protein
MPAFGRNSPSNATRPPSAGIPRGNALQAYGLHTPSDAIPAFGRHSPCNASQAYGLQSPERRNPGGLRPAFHAVAT